MCQGIEPLHLKILAREKWTDGVPSRTSTRGAYSPRNVSVIWDYANQSMTLELDPYTNGPGYY